MNYLMIFHSGFKINKIMKRRNIRAFFLIMLVGLLAITIQAQIPPKWPVTFRRAEGLNLPNSSDQKTSLVVSLCEPSDVQRLLPF